MRSTTFRDLLVPLALVVGATAFAADSNMMPGQLSPPTQAGRGPVKAAGKA